MIAEAFKNAWMENEGMQPVDDDVRVDVVINGQEHYKDKACEWYWGSAIGQSGVTHWRLHHPVDTILPATTSNTAKQEGSNVLKAFNRMTGHSLTEDELNMLKILMEEFGN